MYNIFQGGDNGPETITIKNVPEGITVMYYVKDFSNKVGKTMSWKDSQAKGNLFAPNGGGMLPFGWFMKSKKSIICKKLQDTPKFLSMTLKWMEENDISSLVVLITLVMLDSTQLVKQPLIHLTNVKWCFIWWLIIFIPFNFQHVISMAVFQFLQCIFSVQGEA